MRLRDYIQRLSSHLFETEPIMPRRYSRMQQCCLAAALVSTLTMVRVVQAESPALKDAYKNDFLIGVALGGSVPDDYTAAELAVIRSHFNAVTPENCMKPGMIHPQEGTWEFAQPDALVQFAETNGLQVFGHNLVWHNQTADWFFEDDNRQVSREKLLQRLQAHIETIVGRYKGRIRGWDVVNEALAEGGAKDLRETRWQKIIGDDYIIQAYKFAHAADPSCELQYNDYNIESNPKRDRTVRLIKSMQQSGIPLATVGIQGHWMLDKVPFADIENAIDEFHKLGVKVAITELDLDVIPRQSAGADTTRREADGSKQSGPISAELLQRQAEQYAKLFSLFHKHRDAINRVTFWGLNDGRSWLNYWPRERTDHPLLFDRQCRPKPALQAVIDVVNKSAN
jgi:endo-1,4-beta-xylanase